MSTRKICSQQKLLYIWGQFGSAPQLSLGLRPANERRRYKVTPSLIGWAQT